MKILLIAPASGRWKEVGRRRLFGGKTFRFSMLSLLSVAAETPDHADVRIVDEQIEDIPWNESFDLVGITCMTAAAPRAYEVAARFRHRGVPVVMGGMHPTLCTDEVLKHADAVVVGDAEGLWPQLVDDVQSGHLQRVYRHDAPPTLNGLKPPRYDLIENNKYASVRAVQATRGCPHGCAFCAVSAFNGKTQRQRPVEEVATEVAAIPDRFLLFVDDNLTADREYAARLFRALIPLKKQWMTQSTLSFAEDEAMVALAAKAGCKGLFVGLETFSEENLAGVDKAFNRVDQYREYVRRLHRHGICVEAGVVFGFDHDRTGVFHSTLKGLDRLGIDLVQVSIFTPLPGTPGAATMQDRITDYDWSHYDFHSAVFRPMGMTAEELKDGHDWVTRRFYSPLRILRRLWQHARRPGGLRSLPYLAAINGAYYGRIRTWGIRGRNPMGRVSAFQRIFGGTSSRLSWTRRSASLQDAAGRLYRVEKI